MVDVEHLQQANARRFRILELGLTWLQEAIRNMIASISFEVDERAESTINWRIAPPLHTAGLEPVQDHAWRAPPCAPPEHRAVG